MGTCELSIRVVVDLGWGMWRGLGCLGGGVVREDFMGSKEWDVVDGSAVYTLHVCPI